MTDPVPAPVAGTAGSASKSAIAVPAGPDPATGTAPAADPPPPAARTSAALYDVDADTVAALVLACPAVAGLSAGPFGGAATYLPGRTVPGIRLDPDTVEVHVVARYGPSVAELAGQVRRALAGQVLGRTVDIVVEDLAEPASAHDSVPPPPTSPGGAARTSGHGATTSEP